MTARESVGTGWNTMWHLIGGGLAIITRMAGVIAFIVAIMGFTRYFHETMITKECVDTGAIALINKDYIIECTATPLNQEE